MLEVLIGSILRLTLLTLVDLRPLDISNDNVCGYKGIAVYFSTIFFHNIGTVQYALFVKFNRYIFIH